jgi:phage tail-like protein
MSRGLVEGLGTPYTIGGLLPGVYQEDFFAMRFTAAFDDVLAPAISTLDCLDAFVDPLLTPPDFLEWLAGWVGALLDERAPESRRRALVAGAVDLHRRRGTVAGLQAHLEVLTGGRVEIVDSGGTAWSGTPNSALPGQSSPRLAVRVSGAEWDVPQRLLDQAVAHSKPAHVVHIVEVMT